MKKEYKDVGFIISPEDYAIKLTASMYDVLTEEFKPVDKNEDKRLFQISIKLAIKSLENTLDILKMKHDKGYSFDKTATAKYFNEVWLQLTERCIL